MEERLGVLIGSGVSCAVGYPSMSDITNRIRGFNGKTARERPQQGPEFKNNRSWNTEQGIALIQDFLSHICCLTQEFYYQQRRKINYEDIYYIIKQIEDSEDDEFENPVTEPFTDIVLNYINEKRNDIKEFQSRISVRRRNDVEFGTILIESLRHIKEICLHALMNNNNPLSQIGCLKSLLKNGGLDKINVYTTNHDTAIEQLLRHLPLDFCDGFGEAKNGARWYDPCLLDCDDTRIRLIKLHGSINWYYFPGDENDRTLIGIDLSGDVNHMQDPNGNLRMPGPDSTLMLLGTFNKMLDYSNWIYADMFGHFNRDLRYLDRLVISGYGFGDKGINSVLVNWFEQSHKNRAVVIHPEPEKLREDARGAIGERGRWKKRIDGGQLKLYPKKIEDASWDEVKSRLFENEAGE